MDKISVLMTVYNGGNMLKKSIPGILNQTYSNLEFIIVNDGSSDMSSEIINAFAKQDERIVFVDRKVNKGRSYSLNEGLGYCNSDFVAINDADDVSNIDRLKKQIGFLEKKGLISSFGIIGSGNRIIDTKKNNMKNYHIKYGNISKHKVSKTRIFFGMPFVHSSFIYNKEALHKIGGFPIEVTSFIDYFALIKIADSYPIYGVDQILVDRYIDGNNYFLKEKMVVQGNVNEEIIFNWAKDHYKYFDLLWTARRTIKKIKKMT